MTLLVWSDLTPRSGARQMALDHALLDHAATTRVSVLRLYRWEQDTVSFGANEAALRHWDRDRLESAGVPCVRRPTGGRAVWHAADDLTYSVVAPLGSLGELRLAYRAIHQRIAAALASLGIDSRLAPDPVRLPGLRGGACFDAAVGGEILLHGRKAVGSAQMALRDAMLQHGEITRADRLPALAAFRREAPAMVGAAVATDLPEAKVLADAIAQGWIAAGATTAGPELLARVEAMSVTHIGHYLDPVWTWRR